MKTYPKLREQDPPHKADQNYGFFGYKGAMIEAAIKRDDVEAIRKAHEYGWIDSQTKTLMGHTLRKVARDKNASMVNAELARIGYPE